MEQAETLIEGLRRIVNLLLPLSLSIALLWFMVGMAKFVANAGDEEGRRRGKRHMIVGILVLTLFASIGAITNMVAGALGAGKAVPAPVREGAGPSPHASGSMPAR